MEEENMLETPTLDNATPRFLLQNIMQPKDVQQTVKTRRRNKRRLSGVTTNKSTKSIHEGETSAAVLDATITPRTALLGAMSTSEYLPTVHRPKRKRRLSQPDQVLQEEPLDIVEEAQTQTHDQSRLQDVVEETLNITEQSSSQLQSLNDLPISQPVISMDEYHNKLKAKLAMLKEAKAQAKKKSSLEKGDGTNHTTNPHSEVEFPTIHAENESIQRHETNDLSQSVEEQLNNFHSAKKDTDERSAVDPSLSEEEIITQDNTADEDPLNLSSLHEASQADGPLATKPGDANEVTTLNITEDENLSKTGEENQEMQEVESVHAASSHSSHTPIPQIPLTKMSRPIEKVPKPSLKMFDKRKLPQKTKPVKSGNNIPISSTQLRGIVEHYSTRKVSKGALKQIEQVFGKFFANLCEDMEVASVHAHRKTITRDDMELIMRRQKFITENRSLKVLIEENFPLEYQEILIPLNNTEDVSKKKSATT